MTTTISADNGSVSGTAGLKSTPDSSGALALQTGANTTAVTIDASQNVGVGVIAPLQKFNAVNTSITGGAPASTGSAADPNAVARFQAGNTAMDIGVLSSGQMWLQPRFVTDYSANYDLVLQPNGGNVNIGATASGYALSAIQSVASTNVLIATSNTNAAASSGSGFQFGANGSNNYSTLTQDISGTSTLSQKGAGQLYIQTVQAQPIVFGTTNTERARIDGSGYAQFSGNLVMPYQAAPTAKTTTATLTGAELVTGILTTSGGVGYTVTLPTGANIEAALTWSAVNVSMDWFVISTNTAGTITIAANGNTAVGTFTIGAGSSAHFRIRRTAASTFTVYRLS